MGTLRGRDLEMAKQLSEHTRLVDKKGRNQVSFKDMEEQNALYMKDVFTSMVDAHWYYVLIAFCKTKLVFPNEVFSYVSNVTYVLVGIMIPKFDLKTKQSLQKS